MGPEERYFNLICPPTATKLLFSLEMHKDPPSRAQSAGRI